MQTIHTLTAAELHTLRATIKDLKELNTLIRADLNINNIDGNVMTRMNESYNKLQSIEIQLGGVPQ